MRFAKRQNFATGSSGGVEFIPQRCGRAVIIWTDETPVRPSKIGGAHGQLRIFSLRDDLPRHWTEIYQIQPVAIHESEAEIDIALGVQERGSETVRFNPQKTGAEGVIDPQSAQKMSKKTALE